MLASIVAIILNIVLDYILIYGKFGFEPMGIKGAAIDTVLSRIIELLILLKSYPVVISSILWAFGIGVITQAYSTRGISAVAAFNIASTVNNIFTSIFGSFSITITIILSQLLGGGKIEEAKKANKMMQQELYGLWHLFYHVVLIQI